MKKILCIIPRITGGGAERFFITFLRHIDRTSYQTVAVLVQKGGGFDHEIPIDIPVYILNEEGKTLNMILPLGPLSYLSALINVMKTEKPDAILSFGSLFNGAVAIAAFIARISVPVVLNEVIHESSEISTHHGLSKWGRTLFLRWSYPLASTIIAVSNGVALDLHDHFGLSPKKIQTINHGIDLEQVRSLGRESVDHPWLSADRKEFVIVACGRFVPQKGFDILIAAMKEMPDNVRLILIGDGEKKDELAQQIKKFNLERKIDLVGYDRNPYRYMTKADVFVMPSLWEGFSALLLEAISLGCPLVVSDCPTGPRELIGDNECGILVSPGDPLSLANGIKKLLSDEELRKKLSIVAIKRAEEFSARKSVNAYINLLSKLGGWL